MKNMRSKIKCVVWDLDNTLWEGILSEDSNVHLRQNVFDIITEFDNRGILQSICSKNDYDQSMDKLKELKIDHFFVYPQISWNPKSDGIKNIRELINIGIDTFAFIDDQEFEREEVNYKLPEVMCIDATQINDILLNEYFNPTHLTNDSKNRRLLYQNDIVRNNIKEEFKGTEEDFLRMLDMKFTVSKVKQDDLARAEELTIRTHQLNATGVTYSYDELDRYSKDDNYLVLIARLEDKYGDYGAIGLALVEKEETKWTLKLLLMSCRVMSRGVGSVLLNYVANKAKEAGVDLYAEFIPTDRNRVMFITYKFSGFRKEYEKDGIDVLKLNMDKISEIVDYIKLYEGDLKNV
ncbi:HAD-IIIC family phosphatase [Sedimentibacter sp. zth1]|uniref:HAD-IIIC family phosphatase n=1 Tax=Sedimentibacter sp. zth1 TaxID=2816908 RepID=UPI001A931865|nr:HAD-IIIC family phosphatase [Sedimentibacter sp. zth1]QSX05662.1 HAD-IIIC family phosphatase [Sedimentibacter sp. zth1]